MLTAMVVISSVIIVANLLAHAHAQTTPKDPTNCRLNSTSPFSWVVQIWDEQRPGGAGTVSIGSLITYRAVVTTAWYFFKFDFEYNLDRYKIYGQNIWDYRDTKNYDAARLNPCRQERKIKALTLHPKAMYEGAVGRLLFDYAIIYMDQVFNISSNLFPIMYYQENVREFILGVKEINNSPHSPLCVVPTPETGSNRFLVFNRNNVVSAIPFRERCVSYICGKSSDCINILKSSANNTMLCMVPSWTKDFKIPATPELGDFPTYLAGSPLICGTLTYGISTQEKRLPIPSPDFQQTFFFVITLLRVWKWLRQTTGLYSAEPMPYSTAKGPLSTQTYFDPTISLVSNFDRDLPHRPTSRPRSLPFSQDRKTVSASHRSCSSALMSVGAFQVLLNLMQLFASW